mmetsp:Transcript_25306/g.42700  ORF Transcript_25306/g.42700 Transcript_25306/m.42700 type:complete len:504 (-) Transcript_25306:849-2360(-)|eukprot:CAMPEP_0114427890 /NCGR_PEP_ID=MMETSP0103-20121206/8618_1 /TAXON_ID=37642 ORGANISM="Paraphysomonas imperforata, Strain PA2" /NCGR_SAMPLE_ID=MMETSP0103 /ASSEMBLY_ACC=CAM_ASM_000201 /LENGTH=503 /DNA_ID=CAMNT_0001597039 /DNA_START=66 /DNA_END=1577 /DNA_ORIENTATION=-
MSVQFSRKLFVFRTPEILESFDFAACFHCSSGEESVGEFVKELTRSREKMKISLRATNINSSSLLADIDAYIPLIWQLLDSLDRQDPVKVETPLRFIWKGAIIRGYSKMDNTVFSDVIFDLIMSLHTKAIVMANLAAELTESDPNSVNTAAKHLRHSSSIMNYLASSLIPRWHTKSNYRLTPSETNSMYCAFLSEFFTACSNQMCVAKALQNSATPSSLLTSLCLSVVRGMEACLNNLSTSGIVLKDADSGCREHAGVMREVFSALVYKYQADTFMKKNETGITIALCAVVQARINSNSKSNHYDPFKPAEFPKASTQSQDLRSALSELGESVASLRRVAEEENKMVYFKSVPSDTSQLPELPAPTVLNLPSEAFEPPVSQVIRFSYDPSRKTTIFSAFSSLFAKSSTPNGSATTEKDEKTDNTDKESENLGDQAVENVVNNVESMSLTREASSNSQNSESGLVDEGSVRRLMDMGFMADISRATLLKHNGNETAAINELLGS